MAARNDDASGAMMKDIEEQTTDVMRNLQFYNYVDREEMKGGQGDKNRETESP